jgi:hypothetical protein
MYGADYTTNAGATVYSWSAATGEMFVNGIGQGAPVRNRIFLTVWDGDGTDCYDFSNYATSLKVDLSPGGWSHLGTTAQLAWLGGGPYGGYARGHVFNALQVGGDARSLVEDAIGGAGNDAITGNQAANRLQGGAGSDILTGGGGGDLLVGGWLDTPDMLDTADTAVWSGPRSRYEVRSFEQGGRFVTTVRDLTGAEGTDTLLGVETLGFQGGSLALGVAGVQQNRTGNFDGGAADDVLMQFGATGAVYWQEMQGGQPHGWRLGLSALPAGWHAVGGADMSGDGRADILVQNQSNGSTYFVDLASGTPSWRVVTTSIDSGFRALGTGDLTGDGTPDVVFQGADGFIWGADMEAGGVFGRWIIIANMLNQWQVRGIGDFDRDGAADVMVQEVATGSGATVYRSVLGGSWGFVAGGLGTTWEGRGAADLNGDGFADGVFRNRHSGDILYVDMLGGSGLSSRWGVVERGLAGWDVRAFADIDNDGFKDVVVHNAAAGLTSWRDMDAGAGVGWGVVTAAIGPGWAVV